MYRSILAVLAASGLVASTSAPPPTYYALNQIARVSACTIQCIYVVLIILQFENDVGATQLVAANPVNVYDDMFFQGFEVFVAGTTMNTPGVEAQSPPNVITYGATAVSTILQGTPALTVLYADSTIDHFSFFSFFLGCVVASEETVLGVPQPCTITVTGIDKNGKQVAQQDFKFNTNNGLSQQMIEAKLVGFTGLQTATFSTSASLVGLPINTTTAFLGDNFNYTVYGQNPISP